MTEKAIVHSRDLNDPEGFEKLFINENINVNFWYLVVFVFWEL